MAVPLLENQIRDWILRYLAREISLQDLEQWLVPATWDVDEQRDPAIAELAFTTQLLLAERAKGHLSEAALDAEFRRIASMARLGERQPWATASSATTRRDRWTLQGAVVGTRSEAVPA